MRRQPPAGLFARLLDSLSDIYALVLDGEHQVTYANISFLQHFGLEWKEVAGRACFELGSPFIGADGGPVGFCPTELSPYYPATSILSRKAQEKKHTYEATHYRVPDDYGASLIVLSLKDVTDRFSLESQVRQLDELERNLVQAAMDGIIVNDLLGNILIFNHGAARILGYTPEEVVGKIKVNELYPEKLSHEIKQLLYDPTHDGVGSLENYETLARHKSGALIPIWLSARLLHEEGREIGIVGYFRDLRERKRMEEDLLRNERLATLGKMVAHVSHEIKNPLITIGGFAKQLERQELPADARRKLNLIYQEVQRLEKFLGDLSTFTRGAPAQKSKGDVVALVRAVMELMEDAFKERGVIFQLQPPAPLPVLAFDPAQMRQVLLNIFKNALEAMPQGGQLTTRMEVRGGQLWLKISDTGYGISQENLQRLFTPFFSTKEAGTGLGLTICRELIAQHQGEITLESEAGRGTTCIIRLPLNATP
jgi:PAS domain S-box-containing protein